MGARPFMQQWFALSDPGMEEALHDIPAMRAFAGLDAGDDLIPDESSILRFRHRLEQHGMAEQLLAEINAVLSERGVLLRQGTIVDATLIHAPSDLADAVPLCQPEPAPLAALSKGVRAQFDPRGILNPGVMG